jgi:hypothetical protein
MWRPSASCASIRSARASCSNALSRAHSASIVGVRSASAKGSPAACVTGSSALFPHVSENIPRRPREREAQTFNLHVALRYERTLRM